MTLALYGDERARATLPMFRTACTSPRARIIFFSPLVDDFDNDGWPDIYIACDSTPSTSTSTISRESVSRRSA